MVSALFWGSSSRAALHSHHNSNTSAHTHLSHYLYNKSQNQRNAPNGLSFTMGTSSVNVQARECRALFHNHILVVPSADRLSEVFECLAPRRAASVERHIAVWQPCASRLCVYSLAWLSCGKAIEFVQVADSAPLCRSLVFDSLWDLSPTLCHGTKFIKVDEQIVSEENER